MLLKRGETKGRKFSQSHKGNLYCLCEVGKLIKIIQNDDDLLSRGHKGNVHHSEADGQGSS